MARDTKILQAVLSSVEEVKASVKDFTIEVIQNSRKLEKAQSSN